MTIKPVEMLNLPTILVLSVVLAISSFASLRLVAFYDVPSQADLPVVSAQKRSVQGNFSSIQAAINEAEIGSTVLVPSGVYNEQIVVNKTISLIGENVSTTTIDGNYGGTIVSIAADNVTITGFTIQNSGWGWVRNGIYVHFADNCEIKNNFLLHNCHNIRLNHSHGSLVKENNINGTVTDYGYGIRFVNSINCTAIRNNISNCIGGIHLQNATNCTVKRNYLTENDQGVRLYSPCSYNKIMANTVYNNTYDGVIAAMPPNGTFFKNSFFHNNFVNNTYPFICQAFGSVWDDSYPSGGNYWSRYNGTDSSSGYYQNETGNDGIGDTPYTVNVLEGDKYPLMHPWSLLPVHNINTGIGYNGIQEATDASETLNKHTLWAESGVYHENVNIHKSLKLIGEDRSTTIIDGDNVGTVLSVNADNVSVAGFTVRDSGLNYPPYGDDCGVFMNHSKGGSMSQCLITNNRIGIYLFFSKGNVIKDNVVFDNGVNGILLWYSGNNLLCANEIFNNSYNFGVFGGGFSDFNNTVDASNTVNERPIQYLIGVEDEIIDEETIIGVLYLIECSNVTVQDLNLTENAHGVFCFNVSSSRIKKISVLKNSYGIYLQSSSGNVIDENFCVENWVGICLQDSDHNIVEGNTAVKCEKGISLYEADYNSLRGNYILRNLYGIRLYDSHRNEVFYNNLIENTEQASLYFSYQNTWDNGFEGNFWSDYVGSDIKKDGLGDTAHTIDNANRDRYPLLGAFRNFSVCLDREFYDVTVITNSSILSFSFDDAENTIKLTVNGTDASFGFCRIGVPDALIEPEIRVIIDHGLAEVLYPNYTLRHDGFHRWIYFAYRHSIHEILIIPESLPLFLLSTLMITTLWFVLCKSLKTTLEKQTCAE